MTQALSAAPGTRRSRGLSVIPGSLRADIFAPPAPVAFADVTVLCIIFIQLGLDCIAPLPTSAAPIALRAASLLPERIAESLRAEILANRLEPGARLGEQELATRLGVSRVPLREAFRMLEGEGLVTIEPHRGAVVSGRSDAELREPALNFIRPRSSFPGVGLSSSRISACG